MATGKQQDRNIFLRVLKPCRDPIRSWHSLQTFSPPAAVAPVAPNAWAPMHWALTSIGWLEVGPGACSAPSQVSKQVCAPSSAKELPPDPKHVPSTKKKKKKASLMVQALSPESLFPALLYTANDLQQNHFHLIQLHILHVMCLQSEAQSHSRKPLYQFSGDSPHLIDLEGWLRTGHNWWNWPTPSLCPTTSSPCSYL